MNKNKFKTINDLISVIKNENVAEELAKLRSVLSEMDRDRLEGLMFRAIVSLEMLYSEDEDE